MTSILRLEDIGKSYGSRWIFHGLNITLGVGLTGLLGVNGAGKTTLLRLLASLGRPSAGAIYWKDANLSRVRASYQNRLGYLPQEFSAFPNLTAVEFLGYLAAAKGLPPKESRRRIDELLDLVNLGPAKRKRLSTYSGGMMRRVGIAQALLNAPEILLLDEPTAGLDPDERVELHNLLSEVATNRIVILSTHIISDLEAIADRVLLLHAGQFSFDGRPEQMIEDSRVRSWTVTMPAERARAFASANFASRIVYRCNTAIVRCFGEAPRGHDFACRAEEPNLEDAFLWMTRTCESKQEIPLC